MKASFEYVNYYAVVLAKRISNGDMYAMALKSFLEVSGWTEEEYIKELEARNANV